MRISTKIRHLLQNCSLEFSLNEKQMIQLFCFDKTDNTIGYFESKQYGTAINMCYNYIKKKHRFGQCKKIINRQILNDILNV